MPYEEITVAHVMQFADNVVCAFQQRGSRLRGTVREHPAAGDADFWDVVGKTAVIKKMVRTGDTPRVNTPHDRRMCVMEDFEWADLIDDQDRVRALIDPQSSYVKTGAFALGRSLDDTIIGAFDGIAKAGRNGETDVPFADEMAGDFDFSPAPFYIYSLIQLKKALDVSDVPEQGRHIVLPAAGFAQLLAVTSPPEISNEDYNSVRALVDGKIDTFLGFKFHRSERLPSPGPNLRYGFAWNEQAVGLSMGMEMLTRVDEREDKNSALQVYVAGSFAATRIEGGVVRFLIDEAK